MSIINGTLWWAITSGIILSLVLVGVVLQLGGKNYSKHIKDHDKELANYCRRRPSYPVIFAFFVLAVIGFGLYHYPQLFQDAWMIPPIMLMFIWMVFLLIASHLNPTHNVSPPPDKSRSTLIIPLFNESAETLQAVLNSISGQTLPPNVVWLIDDGSDDLNISKKVFNSWRKIAKQCNIVCHYKSVVENKGKRQAQAVAFRHELDATDIFITVDSDTILDPNAISEGVKPFAKPEIMASAGLLLDLNHRKFLPRIVSLGFVSSFTNGRAAWSALKSVAVNCGGLAFYRSSVIREHLDEYLNQTVFGKPALFGDDRMLTQYATLHGQTVFQESAVGYTLMPENLKHLTKQRVRWWRSFWWGGLWVIRHQSLRKGVWWLVLSQYITFLFYIAVFIAVVFVYPIMNNHFPWQFFVYMFLLSYLRNARTFIVKRPDLPTWKQILEYLWAAPLNSFLFLYIGMILQIYALVTIRSGSWGTRKKIEVSVV